jgi:hypothetical protein
LDQSCSKENNALSWSGRIVFFQRLCCGLIGIVSQGRTSVRIGLITFIISVGFLLSDFSHGISVGQVTNAEEATGGGEYDSPRFSTILPGKKGFQWPTWIEGPGNTILMAFNPGDGVMRIAGSADGGHNWDVISRVKINSGYCYFTRLSDGGLLMAVYEGSGKERRIGWVRSDDHGRTWSKFHTIPIEHPNIHPYGPILEVRDGRWAYCPYSQDAEDMSFRSLFIWSGDRGKTWSKPMAFPTPVDGNVGLTEATVVQIGEKNYVAAIRADEGNNEEARDGFYVSRSRDGLTWSVPVPLGDIGRMPLFYRIDNQWVLSYRQYDPQAGTQYSALRLSSDGKTWSKPHRINQGVNSTPFLVKFKQDTIVFNHRYPARENLTRDVVSIPGLSAR